MLAFIKVCKHSTGRPQPHLQGWDSKAIVCLDWHLQIDQPAAVQRSYSHCIQVSQPCSGLWYRCCLEISQLLGAQLTVFSISYRGQGWLND